MWFAYSQNCIHRVYLTLVDISCARPFVCVIKKKSIHLFVWRVSLPSETRFGMRLNEKKIHRKRRRKKIQIVVLVIPKINHL